MKVRHFEDEIDFTVQDTGSGISQEQKTRLFTNFSKGIDIEGVNKGGTGLGLSICKKIIGQMGGEILLESEEGKGT